MSSPPPPHSTPARRRRLRAAAVLVATAALVAAGWRWHHVTRPDYRLAQGEEAIRGSDWAAAARAIDRLEADGAADHAAVLRGEYFLATGRPDLALGAFNDVRPDGPFRLRAASKAGKCLLDLGSLKEATRVLRYVIEQDPADVEAHRGLAIIAYDLGQMAAAVEYLEVVARLDPVDPRPHRLIGLINKDLGYPDRAEPAYRESIRRGLAEPARSEVAFELAEALVDGKKYAEALDVLDAAGLEHEPPWMSWVRIAALRGAGRQADAVVLADRMVQAHPDEAPFHRLRGQLYTDEGRTGQAVASLERAARLSPHHYQTQFLYAQALAAAGRADDAARATARTEALRKDLDRVSELTREAMARPWDPLVRLQLADMSDRVGEPKLAATWRAAAAACRGDAR